MQILFQNCVLDKFAFIANSNFFTLNRDLILNDFSYD